MARSTEIKNNGILEDIRQMFEALETRFVLVRIDFPSERREFSRVLCYLQQTLGVVPKPKKCTITISRDSKTVLHSKKRLIILGAKKEDDNKISLKKINKELANHLCNAKVIMLNSNATPIRAKKGVDYVCCYCQQSYRDPSLLKAHSLEEHDDRTKNHYLQSQSMSQFCVKLDISDLCCTLCDKSMPYLDTLVDHLITDHKKIYYKDIKSHIIPFKFADDIVVCGVCEADFYSFKNLIEHMNGHFKNFVCEICGAGFVNKKVLYTHANRHQTGSADFPCDLCEKVFDTMVKKRDHQRAMHVDKKRNKCGYCGEKFDDHRKKINHEVKVHGAQPLVFTCTGCQKTFNDRRNLTSHTKRYH